MGLGSFNTGGNATFLRIGMGKDVDMKTKEHPDGVPRAIIGKRAKEGDPGAVPVLFKDEPVVDAEGNALYRTEHAFIEGRIEKIERLQPEFNGKKVDVLNISVDAGGSVYSLQLTRGDDYWIDLALRADNVDWTKSVKIQPYSIPQEDNPKYSNRFLVLHSGGSKAERKYKLKWLREVPEDFVQDADQPPPYIYDADEATWRKGKTLRWLDEGPIQRAIDKVAILNEAPMEKTALDAAVDTAQRSAAPQTYDDGAPAPFDNITAGDESDLAF